MSAKQSGLCYGRGEEVFIEGETGERERDRVFSASGG